MTATKNELEAAYLAGFNDHQTTGNNVSADDMAAHAQLGFDGWYAEKYGERDRRIANKKWADSMDDANRAAGVDI